MNNVKPIPFHGRTSEERHRDVVPSPCPECERQKSDSMEPSLLSAGRMALWFLIILMLSGATIAVSIAVWVVKALLG